jgi:hypothetical protein
MSNGNQRIAFLHDILDHANQSITFKTNNIHLSLDVNAFGNKVEIWNNQKIVMSAKEATLSLAADQLLKWITISGIPNFIGTNIFVENGEYKLISKD